MMIWGGYDPDTDTVYDSIGRSLLIGLAACALAVIGGVVIGLLLIR